jgi:hypothetical protein
LIVTAAQSSLRSSLPCQLPFLCVPADSLKIGSRKVL